MRKTLLFSVLTLAACQTPALPPALSQAGRPPLPVQIQASSATLRFPTDWQGVWTGRCTNTGPAGKQTYTPVEMRLTIQPKTAATGSDWQWKIEYIGGGQNQVRDYSLKAVDPAKGQWLIDEHNGILLDNFMVDGGLVQEAFSVGSTLIVGSHRLLDRQNLKVELISFSLQSPRNSGSQEYPVSSFRLQSVQDCPLSKL